MRFHLLTLLLCGFALLHCRPASNEVSASIISSQQIPQFDTTYKSIHLYVALCDNKYQGIVPVPAKIGNGQDPGNNLYWGCGYGVSSFFKKSAEWKLVRKLKPNAIILERLIFKNTTKNCYLVADAYDGQYIKQCTQSFLKSSCGNKKDTIHINNSIIGIEGNANMVGYIGHDGLMDFQLDETYKNTDAKKRDVIILACYSKSYFSPLLKQANVNPLLWTTGLMCPEAYTFHNALTEYLNNQSNSTIRNKAALTYSQYQKCSEKAAKNLLVAGW